MFLDIWLDLRSRQFGLGARLRVQLPVWDLHRPHRLLSVPQAIQTRDYWPNFDHIWSRLPVQ